MPYFFDYLTCNIFGICNQYHVVLYDLQYSYNIVKLRELLDYKNEKLDAWIGNESM